jgi:hypothetical protein
VKERRFKIPLPTYEYMVTVVISDDPNASASKLHKKLIGSDKEFDIKGAIQMRIGNQAYVILPPKRSLSYIVHESFHVVWGLLDHIGAEPEEEIIAYTLDYLASMIWGLYPGEKFPEFDKPRKKKRRI